MRPRGSPVRRGGSLVGVCHNLCVKLAMQRARVRSEAYRIMCSLSGSTEACVRLIIGELTTKSDVEEDPV